MNTNPAQQLGFVNELAFQLRDRGIIHLTTDGSPMPDRRILHIDNKELLNFSSCNYVGLEADPRLKQAAIDAIHKYGVQFYTVRAYVSLQPYEELESLLNEMFGLPTVVMPTTMLSHITCLPVLIGDGDAVILDHQVHTSVQVTAKILKSNGAYIETIRHDRMDYLENRVKKLSAKYKKIWYLADGVYSMYGDIASMKELHTLLEENEQFHVYIDDSHGMSWTGKNGTGTVFERIAPHPRLVVVSSMGKAFGASGGVGVFYDKGMREKIRNCGSPLIFTGPLQPSILGAAVASAKIHLSEEINVLQNQLKEKINYFFNKANELKLPMLGNGDSPIFFLGVGKPEVGFKMVERLKEKGLFTCIAVYPSVPVQRTGLRFLLTVHHTKEDMDNLLEAASLELNRALEEENLDIEKIKKRFGLVPNINTVSRIA